MNEHLTALKKRRKKERAHAIANNLVDDPNRQRRLQDAITFTGTCPDMCPAFERVERIVQKAVDGCEKTVAPDGQEVPSEELMVKRFRRSAAGDDAQLPSDVRAPPILKKTLDYLINDVVGGPKPLSRTHAFLWDRTRSIRNDFTIQNVQGSKNADLLLAIDCYERIARFHVHALHDFARPDVDDSGFTAHNEREQLNKTLLSLMEFYDLSAFRSLKCPNEAEFRAYNIVMHFHDQDIEREAMNLGRERPELYNHPRIQRALELYAAVTNTHDLHGPLRPSASNPIAQNNVAKFFRLVRSSQISYTMACVAEIHFNHIRKNALTALRAGFRSPATMQDCSLRHLKDMLGFDNEVQVRAFCEACGMDVADGGIGKEAYLVLTSGPQQLVDPGGILRQPFSETVVEHKRHGRTLPHVINGLTVRQARAVGGLMERPKVQAPAHTQNGPPAFSFTSGATSSFGKPSFASDVNHQPPTNGSAIFGPPKTSVLNTAAQSHPFSLTDSSTSSAPFSAPNSVEAARSVSSQQPAAPLFALATSNSSISKDTPLSKPSSLSAASTSSAFGAPSVLSGTSSLPNGAPQPKLFSFSGAATSSAFGAPSVLSGGPSSGGGFTQTQPPSVSTASTSSGSGVPRVLAGNAPQTAFKFGSPSTSFFTPAASVPAPPTVAPRKENILESSRIPSATHISTASTQPSLGFSTGMPSSASGPPSVLSGSAPPATFKFGNPATSIFTPAAPESTSPATIAPPAISVAAPSLSKVPPTTTVSAPPTGVPQPASTAPTARPTVPTTKAVPPSPAQPKKLPESVVQWYFCSEGGLMDDFIDFGLPQMVQDAYDEYEKEQAASFRRRKVSERFFYRWKYTAQRKGLVARGRQSRHRMSLLISQQRKRKNGSDSSSLVEQVTRRAMQPPPTEPGRRHKRAKTVPDATSMMRPPPPAQAKSTPVGERRSRRSSSNTSSSMSSLSSSHLQGASVFSPSVLADARAIINQSGGGDTIQSDYWRLKAAGLKTLPNGVTEPTTMPRSSSAARKRALEADDDPEDAETEAEAKSPPKRLASSSRVNGHHRVPQKQDEDEALFAELAALRAAMDEGIEFYRGWGEGTWS